MTENPKPIPVEFIEVAPGIKVASNVKVPEFLNFRQGQNFYDQPPFSWLFADPELIPEGLFAFETEELEPEVADEQFQQALGRSVTATMYMDRLRAFPTDPRVSNQALLNSKSPSEIAQIRQQLERYLGPILNPDFDLKSKENLAYLLAFLRKIANYLSQFPDSMDYVAEHMANQQGSTFDLAGQPKENRTKGSYQLRTYAGYVARRRSLDPHWAAWVGLESELPTDFAESWVEGRKIEPDQQFFSIIAISLLSSDPE